MSVGQTNNIAVNGQYGFIPQQNNPNGYFEKGLSESEKQQLKSEIVEAAAATDAMSETPTIKEKIENIISSILDPDGDIASQMKNITMKIAEIQEDRFEREDEKENAQKDKDNNTANIQKKDIRKSYSAYNKLANSNAKDIIGLMIEQGEISEAEKSNFDTMYKNLIKDDSSNKNVLEKVNDFIRQAKEMEKKVNFFKREKNEVLKGTSLTIETVDKSQANKLTKDDDESVIQDKNNPFVHTSDNKSKYDVEEQEVAAV